MTLLLSRLAGMSIQSEAKAVSVTRDSHKLVRANLTELNDELQLLIQAGDHEQAEAAEKEIAKLEDYLRKNEFKGHERSFCKQYKRDLDSVRAAINRAIKSIGTANSALAWHLTTSVSFGVECGYAPEKPVLWDL